MTTPRPLPLPPGWTEETLDGGRLGVSEGRFAWSARASRQIVYFRRWWMRPAWPFIWPFIRDHERGHAWGVPASGCLAGRSDCLMSEEAGGDSWWGKIKLWPRQALRLGRPCPACAAFIEQRIKETKETTV